MGRSQASLPQGIASSSTGELRGSYGSYGSGTFGQGSAWLPRPRSAFTARPPPAFVVRPRSAFLTRPRSAFFTTPRSLSAFITRPEITTSAGPAAGVFRTLCVLDRTRRDGGAHRSAQSHSLHHISLAVTSTWGILRDRRVRSWPGWIWLRAAIVTLIRSVVRRCWLSTEVHISRLSAAEPKRKHTRRWIIVGPASVRSRCRRTRTCCIVAVVSRVGVPCLAWDADVWRGGRDLPAQYDEAVEVWGPL